MTVVTQILGQDARPSRRAKVAPALRPMAREAAADDGNGLSEELKRLVAGDQAAWEGFVQRYARVIFAAVQRRLVPAGRPHEVDDVTQDVFVKICSRDFKLLRSFDPARAKLSTFLTVVATSSAIDHLRRNSKPTTDIDAVPQELLSVEPKVVERIKIPPELLSPRQALVMELLYAKELEPAEAAEVMGVAPHTVRSMHHKALTKLRAHFQAEVA
ncbi:MAG: sigma-70 family RNA polymerase sigma factor [Pseudomonadota bacterium]